MYGNSNATSVVHCTIPYTVASQSCRFIPFDLIFPHDASTGRTPSIGTSTVPPFLSGFKRVALCSVLKALPAFA
jgi:hypothetical protein